MNKRHSQKLSRNMTSKELCYLHNKTLAHYRGIVEELEDMDVKVGVGYGRRFKYRIIELGYSLLSKKHLPKKRKR